jgi:ATP-dependent DNA helicase RecG
MVEQAETYLLAAMRKSTLIEGLFRRDIPVYPQEVVREAVCNAVAHRDYSSYVRGSYIQIRMFANRLEIQSPGGLFGNVTVENIEEEHSTRNARLMRMMEDMHLVENRGSGIKAMLHAMRHANMEPPRFDDRRSSFKVVFMNHTLMNPEAVSWLNQFRGVHLDDRQRLALVFLRHHDAIANSEYRRLTHVDALMAGQELRGLVQSGLVEQRGAGRWTSYVLKTRDTSPGATGEVTRQVPDKYPTSTRQVTPQEVSVLQAAVKPASRSTLQQSSGLRDREHFMDSVLKPLLDGGLLEITIPDKPRSSKQSYRLTEKRRQLLAQMAEGS